MLQAMVVNRKDGKGANKIQQNASNTCIPCSKPYRFPAQTTRKNPKTLSFFFAPYRFTGLRDCPTQCARLLHPASTRVLPVPHVSVLVGLLKQNRGRFLVYLLVQSSSRETNLFSQKDTYGVNNTYGVNLFTGWFSLYGHGPLFSDSFILAGEPNFSTQKRGAQGTTQDLGVVETRFCNRVAL